MAFYLLRLSLAPVIETVLLLDRCLYLHEQGIGLLLVSILDPKLSPRNQAMVTENVLNFLFFEAINHKDFLRS